MKYFKYLSKGTTTNLKLNTKIILWSIKLNNQIQQIPMLFISFVVHHNPLVKNTCCSIFCLITLIFYFNSPLRTITIIKKNLIKYQWAYDFLLFREWIKKSWKIYGISFILLRWHHRTQKGIKYLGYECFFFVIEERYQEFDLIFYYICIQQRKIVRCSCLRLILN